MGDAAADEVDFWRAGEVRLIPAMYAAAQDCVVLAVTDTEVRFRTRAGWESMISRSLLRQLLAQQRPISTGRHRAP